MHESAGAREVVRSAMTNSESGPEPLRLGGRQRPAQPLPAGSPVPTALLNRPLIVATAYNVRAAMMVPDEDCTGRR
jgi:hypothetical protein